MLSRLVTAFLPRSKHLLISLLQSPSAVILEPRKIKSVTVSTFSASIYHEVMAPDAVIFICWMLSFKPAFSLSSFTLTFLPLEWYHLLVWGWWYFSKQSWFQPVLHPAWHFAWCTLCISYGAISNCPPLFPSSILDTFDLGDGGLSSGVISFCLFMGFSQ